MEMTTLAIAINFREFILSTNTCKNVRTMKIFFTPFFLVIFLQFISNRTWTPLHNTFVSWSEEKRNTCCSNKNGVCAKRRIKRYSWIIFRRFLKKTAQSSNSYASFYLNSGTTDERKDGKTRSKKQSLIWINNALNYLCFYLSI